MFFLVSKTSVKVYSTKSQTVCEKPLLTGDGNFPDRVFNWIVKGRCVKAYNKGGDLIKENNLAEDGWYESRNSDVKETGHFGVVRFFGLSESILEFASSLKARPIYDNKRLEKIKLDPRVTNSLELGLLIGERFGMNESMTKAFLSITDLDSAKRWVSNHFHPSTFLVNNLILSDQEGNWQVRLLGPDSKQPANPLALITKKYGFDVLESLISKEYLEIAKGGDDYKCKPAHDFLSEHYVKVSIGKIFHWVKRIYVSERNRLLVCENPMPDTPGRTALEYLIKKSIPLEIHSSFEICDSPRVIEYFLPMGEGDTMSVIGLGNFTPPPYPTNDLSPSISIAPSLPGMGNKQELSTHVFCSGIGGRRSDSRGLNVVDSLYLTKANESGIMYCRSIKADCDKNSRIIIARLSLGRIEGGSIARGDVTFETYAWDEKSSRWIKQEKTGNNLYLLVPSSFQAYDDSEASVVLLGRELTKT